MGEPDGIDDDLPEFDFFEAVRSSLKKLDTRACQFVRKNENLPKASSIAMNERKSYAQPESIASAWSIATQLIDFGSEHVSAFVKLVGEPAEPIAAATSVRSMLESCSLSAWLLDPSINAQERVGRTFALRYSGMAEELKLARSMSMSKEVAKMELRLNEVERDAIGLGFAPVVDKKGKRSGIGRLMPKSTEMIATVMNERFAYQMLSGIAHGHSWAIRGFAFTDAGRITVEGLPMTGFKKTVDATRIGFLAKRVIKAFTMPIWNQCRYYGWDQLELEEIFEDAADGMTLSDAIRFWRT